MRDEKLGAPVYFRGSLATSASFFLDLQSPFSPLPLGYLSIYLPQLSELANFFLFSIFVPSQTCGNVSKSFFNLCQTFLVHVRYTTQLRVNAHNSSVVRLYQKSLTFYFLRRPTAILIECLSYNKTSLRVESIIFEI